LAHRGKYLREQAVMREMLDEYEWELRALKPLRERLKQQDQRISDLEWELAEAKTELRRLRERGIS